MAKKADAQRFKALQVLPAWARPLAEARLPVQLQLRMAASSGALVDTLSFNDAGIAPAAWRAAFEVADEKAAVRLAQRVPDAESLEWLLGARRRAKVLNEAVKGWHLSPELVELLAASHPHIPVAVADHLLHSAPTHPRVWPLLAAHASPAMALRWVARSGWVGSSLDARVRAARGDVPIAAEPLDAVPAAQFVDLVGHALGPSMGAIGADALAAVVPAVALRPDTHELLLDSSWWFLLGPLRMAPDLQERFAAKLCRWGPTTEFQRLLLCAATFVDRFDTDPRLAQDVLDALGAERAGGLLAAGVLPPHVWGELSEAAVLDVALARSADPEVLRGQQWLDLLIDHAASARTLTRYQEQRLLRLVSDARPWITTVQVGVARAELLDAGVSFPGWGWDKAAEFLGEALPVAVAGETSRIRRASKGGGVVERRDMHLIPGDLPREAFSLIAECLSRCADEGAAWDVVLGLLENFSGKASALADAAVAVAGIPSA